MLCPPNQAVEGNAKSTDTLCFPFKYSTTPKSCVLWQRVLASQSRLSPIVRGSLHSIPAPPPPAMVRKWVGGFPAMCRGTVSLPRVGRRCVHLHDTCVLWPFQPMRALCKLCHELHSFTLPRVDWEICHTVCVVIFILPPLALPDPSWGSLPFAQQPGQISPVTSLLRNPETNPQPQPEVEDCVWERLACSKHPWFLKWGPPGSPLPGRGLAFRSFQR